MKNWETILLLSGGLLYLLSFFRGYSMEAGQAVRFLFAGFLAHLFSIAIRWYAIGHPPVFGTYEAALAASWFLVIFILSTYRSIYEHFRLVLLTGLPMVVLILSYGFLFNRERIPLTISERSLWVDFHALFSWLAYAPFSLAFSLSLYLLWLSLTERSNNEGAVSADILDELIFRYVNWGFISHTIMFSLGCYYSSILYGKWWIWDPAESTSLISWLAVALYIHMRLFYNWSGRKAAWLFVAVFTTIIFSYWGLIYLPAGSTFHIFDIDMKAH